MGCRLFAIGNDSNRGTRCLIMGLNFREIDGVELRVVNILVAFFAITYIFICTGVSMATVYKLDVKEKVLKNGLKVLVLEDHSTPTATFQVWYKVGSRNEKSGKTGISHLLEHMMFKGTERYGPGEFSKIVSRNGGTENAFTSRDYTAYFENWASDRLAVSMDLESDRMRHLKLDEHEFESEKQVVMEERRLRTEDDPVSLLVEEVFATAYKVHPYHWPVIGWMCDIENITLEDLRRHYKLYYAPNNATIVVVGDVKADKVFQEVQRYFGGLSPSPFPNEANSKEPPQQGEKRVTVESPEARLPFVMLAYHVPHIGSGEEYALEILSHVLGEGKSSKLYERLVYEEKAAVFTSAHYQRISKDPGLLYLYAGVVPGRSVKDVEAMVREEVAKIERGELTEEELQKAKNQVKSSFVYGLDSNFYRAMKIGRLETVGIGWRYLETYLEKIGKVTREAVEEVAKRYLSDRNLTVGVLIPQSKGEAQEAIPDRDRGS